MLLGAIAAALVASGVEEAHALENEWHLGLAPRYALLATGPADARVAWHGGGGGVYGRYGLDDMFDLTAEVALVAYPAGAVLAPEARVGVAYVFDTFRIVPALGLDAGAAWFVPTACAAEPCGIATRASLGIPGLVEVRLDESITVGVHVRYGLLVGGASLDGVLDASGTVGLAF
jgi:hypothetical protein